MRLQNKYIPPLKTFSVALLLGIFIAASLFNNLHQYFHHDHHQTEICTEEAENDPCHIKAFHHNITEGCKHETHVYSLETKCELCDAIIAKYHFPDDEIEEISFNDFSQSILTFENPFILRISNTSNPLRGPPVSLFLPV